jgi:hypothetical protein
VHIVAATGLLRRVAVRRDRDHGGSLPPCREAGVTTPSPPRVLKTEQLSRFMQRSFPWSHCGWDYPWRL